MSVGEKKTFMRIFVLGGGKGVGGGSGKGGGCVGGRGEGGVGTERCQSCLLWITFLLCYNSIVCRLKAFACEASRGGPCE